MGLKNIISFCPAPNFRNIFQFRTNGVRLESQHTIMSHGLQLARNHKHDWLILIVLVIIEIVLYIIHPFYRFVGRDMMDDLRYPLKENTIPVWSVPLYAVLLPIVIFLLYYIRRRDVYDVHHSILGLLFSVLITAVLTDSIKNGVGRPRPNFFWRCFPDGVDEYDRWGNVLCHGKESDIKGHKSFPSGHTSCLVVATFCYLQFFPPPYQTEGWGPYAYFQAVEESRSNTLAAAALPWEGGTTMQAAGRQQLAAHMSGNLGSTLDDMELGRK